MRLEPGQLGLTIRRLFCRTPPGAWSKPFYCPPWMNATDGLTMTTAYQGEQTLLVTRPTRLIALRYWTAMVLALIVAGVLFFQVPWRFVSLGNPALAGVPMSSIVAAFFVFFAFLAFVMAELKRRTTRHIITDNKIIPEDGTPKKNTEMIPYTQPDAREPHQ